MAQAFGLGTGNASYQYPLHNEQSLPSKEALDQLSKKSSLSDETQVSSVSSNVSQSHSALAKDNSALQLNSAKEVPKASHVQSVEKNQSNVELLKELRQKGNACSLLFVSTMNNQDAPQHIRDVLTALNDVYDHGSFTRNGEVLDKSEFTRTMFHTAMLSGAHIVVNDGGQLAKNLLQLGGQVDNGFFNYWLSSEAPSYDGNFYDRSGSGQSSHYGKDGQKKEQWGADLGQALLKQDLNQGAEAWMGHLLMGKTDNNNSFFQFENNGIGTYEDKYWHHSGDAINHVVSGKMQIGPQGKVYASEKNGDHFEINLQSNANHQLRSNSDNHGVMQSSASSQNVQVNNNNNNDTIDDDDNDAQVDVNNNSIVDNAAQVNLGSQNLQDLDKQNADKDSQ